MINLRSIRARLTLWSVAALAAILAIFSATATWNMRQALLRALEHTLEMQADAVADSYDPEEGRFNVLHEGEEEANEALSAWIRIVAEDGGILYETAAMGAAGWPFPYDRASELRDRADFFFQKLVSRSGRSYLAVIYPVWRGSQLVAWVQLALPTKQVSDPLHRLIVSLLIAAPVALLLAGFTGYWLADRALRPVEVIRSRAESISQANLAARVPVPGRGDELSRLAETFNAMLDRLEAAFKAQQRFIADASHELKTPIAILRARWENEINDADLPQEVRTQLTRDVEELARLNKLVEDLLLLTRADEGKIPLAREPVSLDELLNSLLEDARTLASGKEQKIHTEITTCGTVQGDRNRLYQLFLNLVDNAVKYSQPGATIRITCERRGARVVVAVQDDGPGIPPEDLPLIFDRFYRVDKSRSRELGGSGLGLSICKWIAEAHGGSITVQSQPGQGTRVEVSLPATA
ncbi:MAG: HAMP domain-containing protein [Calditrichaeota bacterium]|nr:HAMP domain-containing protein [Calditrichota bacterium]